MRRYEESQEGDFERMVRLGEENAVAIANAKQWCEHLHLTPTFGGLYAQLIGPQIAGHEISCPYVGGGSEGMNLTWICSDFITSNCIGCEYHKPNGDDSWGRQAITQFLEDKARREQEATQQAARLSQLRTELLEHSKTIGHQAPSESHRIISFLEGLFSDDAGIRTTSQDRLTESARIGADLFPTAAVNLICELATTTEFADSILSVCSELAIRRPDISGQLVEVATSCLERRLAIEKAAGVLVQLDNHVSYPLASQHIKALIDAQNHILPIGGWRGGEPSFESASTLLMRCYDAAPNSILEPIRDSLRTGNQCVRINVCGAVQLIQERRPEVGPILLPELMRALDLREEERFETASGKIVKLLAAAFRYSPDQLDPTLADAMHSKRPAVQEDIIRVYRDLCFDRDTPLPVRNARGRAANVRPEARVATRRLLDWVKDKGLETDIRSEAAEALEIACKYAPDAIIPEFDGLLGYYALLCAESSQPDAPQRIILPTDPKKDPQLEQLEAMGRAQQWRFLKQRIRQCMEELCDSHPDEVCTSTCACFQNASSSVNEEFRAGIVSLLGKLGEHFQLQRRIVPLVMKALMDYDSTWCRANAITATKEMFSRSSPPPSNIVDIVLVHLRDSRVMVHKAAVRALSWSAWWLNDEQAREALQSLAVHLQVYRQEVFELKEICETIHEIGRRHERLAVPSLRLIETVFPTGEQLVDSDIVENFYRSYEPDEPPAGRIARHFATFLGKYKRDDYGSDDHSVRQQLFRWLREMTPSAFGSVKAQLLTSALDVARRDGWEASCFASVFSHFNCFVEEAEILSCAAQSLPQEHRFKTFKGRLANLASLAAANGKLKLGDIEAATEMLAREDYAE